MRSGLEYGTVDSARKSMSGSDANADNAMGHTPLELGTTRGCSEVAEYLRHSPVVPQHETSVVYPHASLPSAVSPPLGPSPSRSPPLVYRLHTT